MLKKHEKPARGLLLTIIELGYIIKKWKTIKHAMKTRLNYARTVSATYPWYLILSCRLCLDRTKMLVLWTQSLSLSTVDIKSSPVTGIVENQELSKTHKLCYMQKRMDISFWGRWKMGPTRAQGMQVGGQLKRRICALYGCHSSSFFAITYRDV